MKNVLKKIQSVLAKHYSLIFVALIFIAIGVCILTFLDKVFHFDEIEL